MNDLNQMPGYLQLLIYLTVGNVLMFLLIVTIAAFVSHTRGC